jgi:hypothetical protein
VLAALRLRRSETLGRPCRRRPAAGHDDLPALEVDVVPSQYEGFGSPQAGEGYRLEQRGKRLISDRVEELAELLRRPRLRGLSLLGGQLDVGGRVELHPAGSDSR